MIAEEIKSDNLLDYYNKLTKLQQEHHENEYSLVHEEIRTLLSECNSYTEFGVKQGTTLAVAVLSNTKKIRGYDITLKWYLKAEQLFQTFTEQYDIDFNVIEESSLLCNIESVDLLYIDDLHKYHQVSKELKLHSDKVNKYIVLHDTKLFPELTRAINDFLSTTAHWKIKKISNDNVGFTTLVRN